MEIIALILVFALVIGIGEYLKRQRAKKTEIRYAKMGQVIDQNFETLLKERKTFSELVTYHESIVSDIPLIDTIKSTAWTVLTLYHEREDLPPLNDGFWNIDDLLAPGGQIGTLDANKNVLYYGFFQSLTHGKTNRRELFTIVTTENVFITEYKLLDQLRRFAHTETGGTSWDAVMNVTGLSNPYLDLAYYGFKRIDRFNTYFSESVKNTLLSKYEKNEMIVIPLNNVIGIRVKRDKAGNYSQRKVWLFKDMDVDYVELLFNGNQTLRTVQFIDYLQSGADKELQIGSLPELYLNIITGKLLNKSLREIINDGKLSDYIEKFLIRT